ncbi:MAG: hypothetical protein CM15mP49_01870 [Actinomycetota bacterium]|nr:MAG: hypothetical protein CM15mP49_01870 [Actinomycetota bacterium]
MLQRSSRGKLGIQRFASASCPLDEALVDVSLDLSGRPFHFYDVEAPGQKILSDPPFDPQLIEEFWRAFVMSSEITAHQVLIRGKTLTTLLSHYLKVLHEL